MNQLEEIIEGIERFNKVINELSERCADVVEEILMEYAERNGLTTEDFKDNAQRRIKDGVASYYYKDDFILAEIPVTICPEYPIPMMAIIT